MGISRGDDLRRRDGSRPKRERELKVALDDEEYEAPFAAAGGRFAAAWARDVPLSRAAALRAQRAPS